MVLVISGGKTVLVGNCNFTVIIGVGEKPSIVGLIIGKGTSLVLLAGKFTDWVLSNVESQANKV